MLAFAKDNEVDVPAKIKKDKAKIIALLEEELGDEEDENSEDADGEDADDVSGEDSESEEDADDAIEISPEREETLRAVS